MKQNQSGSVLAISLVLLTAITLVSMQGLQRSALHTKIVNNIQHQEKLFRSAASDQEARYDKYNTDPEASKLLFDIINNFDVGDLGKKEQKSIDLVLLDGHSEGGDQPGIIKPSISSTSLYILGSTDSNKITLAVGHDVGSHTNHYFQIDSSAAFQHRPSITSSQRTGFHFPALIIGQNSL